MIENYKYTLDRSSKKFVCPACNMKKFVRYVETETGSYLHEDFGRCDRETSCGYYKAPSKEKIYYLIEFLSLKNISEKAYRMTDAKGFVSIVPKSQIMEIDKKCCWVTERYLKGSTISYLNSKSKSFNQSETINNCVIVKNVIPITPSNHSLELLDKMYNDNKKDNLSEFLKTVFSHDEVKKATQNYLITGTDKPWEQSTIFWQIDENDTIHAGKIMLYNAQTGKRIKKPYNCINWLHKVNKEPEFALNQCLFGLHLTKEDYNKKIAIVESEKTAIIMSILLPEFIWLATGSKQNLNEELLKPIRKRKIVLFPDKGEFLNWTKKAESLKNIGFKIAVSVKVEENGFESGSDLADIFVRGVNC